MSGNFGQCLQYYRRKSICCIIVPSPFLFGAVRRVCICQRGLISKEELVRKRDALKAAKDNRQVTQKFRTLKDALDDKVTIASPCPQPSTHASRIRSQDSLDLQGDRAEQPLFSDLTGAAISHQEDQSDSSSDFHAEDEDQEIAEASAARKYDGDQNQDSDAEGRKQDHKSNICREGQLSSPTRRDRVM